MGDSPLHPRLQRSLDKASRNHEGYPEDQRGDAWEPKAPEPEPEGTPEPRPDPFRLEVIDSATFARTEYKLDWDCRGLLVRLQPAVLGGPKKALKTSLLIDLAVSLGTGTAFLDHFACPCPRRVLFLSGESGEATLKETALRGCAAKGIDLADAGVSWCFRLPHLADPGHLGVLLQTIRQHRAEVLLLDPLYLSLLAGMGGQGPQASNLYQMGPLLMTVARTCIAAGCTPVLAHHFKITRAEPDKEPQLEDLSHAGIQEFARQWVLLGRREKYQPGTGRHQLWLSVGGSAGQSGLWALDIDEGAIDEDFRGRRWDVTLKTASEFRESFRTQKDADKAEAKVRKNNDDDRKVLTALDRLDPNRQGAGCNQIRVEADIPKERMQRSVRRLREEGILEPVEVTATAGNGAKLEAEGVRRCAEEEG
jgi:replicative DNA helicase